MVEITHTIQLVCSGNPDQRLNPKPYRRKKLGKPYEVLKPLLRREAAVWKSTQASGRPHAKLQSLCRQRRGFLM